MSSATDSATITLVAETEEIRAEMHKHAWNDDTLDFLLNKWNESPNEWDAFTLLHQATLLTPEVAQDQGNSASVFAIRVVYEQMFGERITVEQASTFEVHKRLWQDSSPSKLPADSWALLKLDPGVGDQLLESLWNKELTSPKKSNRRRSFPSRRSPSIRHHSLALALLKNSSISDKEAFKWLVRTANWNSPHRDTWTLSAIVNSVVGNYSVSRRTLRTALRICLRTIPAEGSPERDHYYYVGRQLMLDALKHPQMDYAILEGLRDGNLISQVDYEGYVDELALYLYPEEAEVSSCTLERSTTYELDSELVKDLASSQNLLTSAPSVFDEIPKGFPLPTLIWDAIASNLETHSRGSWALANTKFRMAVRRVSQIAATRPSPPKEVVIRIIRTSITPDNPINEMLYHYGYAVERFRDQAKADGIDADNLPLEWILQIYS